MYVALADETGKATGSQKTEVWSVNLPLIIYLLFIYKSSLTFNIKLYINENVTKL